MGGLNYLAMRLNSGIAAKKKFIVIKKPISYLCSCMLVKLNKLGFIETFKKCKLQEKNKKVIECLLINLNYGQSGENVFKFIKKISSNDSRKNLTVKMLWQNTEGSNTLILTTINGLLTSSEAKQQNVGGILLYVITT